MTYGFKLPEGAGMFKAPEERYVCSLRDAPPVKSCHPLDRTGRKAATCSFIDKRTEEWRDGRTEGWKDRGMEVGRERARE